MGFIKKEWKDRLSEFPTRRRLTKEDGSTALVTVAREEGTISNEGDAFSAENMNDFEERVETAFEEVNKSLDKIQHGYGGATSAINANSYAEYNVSFEKKYGGIPVVVVCLRGSGDYTNATIQVHGITENGFTVKITNGSSHAVQPGFTWMAMI